MADVYNYRPTVIKLIQPNQPQYKNKGVSVFSHIKIPQKEAIIASPQKITSAKGDSLSEVLLLSKELK